MFPGLAPDPPAPQPLAPRSGPGWDEVLDSGEALLWQGRPDPGFRFRWGHVPLAGVGLVLFVLAGMFLQHAAEAVQQQAENARGMVAFGVATAGLGLWAMVGPAVVDMLRRRGTQYALTDRRALVETDFLGKGLVAWPIGPGSPIHLRKTRPPIVYFALMRPRPGPYDRLRGTRMNAGGKLIAFEYIEDGEAVHDMLQRIREECRA